MTDDAYASIADIYDFSYDDFTEDIDFYRNFASVSGGPVLELGAGTGRVAIPLAQAGYEVVGLDASPAMLDRARRNLEATKLKKGRVDFVEGNMTAFDLDRRFGLVFIAANTFQHLLSTKDQAACMARVSRHLAPGGIFAMSIRSPATVSWDNAEGWAPLLLHWTRTDLDSGEVVMKFCAEQPDPPSMTRRLTYVYDRVAKTGETRRSVFVAELRYSTQSEIELLLQQAGLRVTHVYGDYDLSPVGQGDNLVFVARAESSR
jgi:SAM-dependent methyltransferase